MHIPDKIIDLAKKLHALSERGVGGEKENAAQHLDRIMKQHNLSVEDILGDTKSEKEFSVPKESERLLYQIMGAVAGKNVKCWEYTGNPKKKGKIYAEITDAEYIEILSKHDFYWQAYQKDVEFFYEAFIHKHDLGAKSTEPPIPLSKEEREKIQKMFEMMEVMNKHEFQKRIS